MKITLKDIWNSHGSEILAVLASLGVVGTAALAVSETPKAIEKIHADSKKNHDGDAHAFTNKEAIQSAWKFYIPAATVGIATISCIVGNSVHRKHVQASISSAAGLISSSYNEYRAKVRELYGQETDNNIINSIMKDHCKEVHLTADGLIENSTLEFVTKEPEIVRTFYDTYSKRYFESTISRVLQAEYHFNRNYTLGGGACINEFYEFLGLDPIAGGDDVGFRIDIFELVWVDFNHRVETLEDGMEVCVIDYPWYPEPLIDEE